MTTSTARRAILDQIAADIHRCAEQLRQAAAGWPTPQQTLADQLWELSQARIVQLELATWDSLHGYPESAAEHRRRAVELREQAMRLLDQANEAAK